MSKDLNKIISDLRESNSILLNDIKSYPAEIINIIKNSQFDDRLLLNFNIIGVHFTRLFDYEVEDIKIHGLHSDDTADYKSKINRMPKEFNKFKLDLIKYVSAPKNKRSDGNIHFDVGKIEITEDNIIFLKCWGGETLYSIFESSTFNKQDSEQLQIMLAKNTSPYMVVVCMQAFQFFAEYADNKSIKNCIESNTIKNYEGEHFTDKSNIRVIDVIPIKSIS